MRSRFRAFFEGMTLGEQRVLIGLIVVGTVAAGVRYYSARNGEGFKLIGQVDPKTNEIVRVSEAAHGGTGAALVSGTNDRPVDVNTASQAQLMSIKGIGPVLSQTIIEYRDQHGLFRSVDDLAQVPGIGPKTLEKIRLHLCVADVAAPASTLAPTTVTAESVRGGETTAASPLNACSTPNVSTQKTATSANQRREPATAPSSASASASALLDINRASQAELEALPGIGEVKAKRILQYRAAHGAFASLDELGSVSGIGPKTLDALRPLVTCGTASPTSAPASSATGASPAAAPSPAPVVSGPVNLNTATQAQLEALPGIGPVHARQIIEYRKTHGAFRAVSDLDKIRGIGPKTVETLRPLVFVGK